MSRTARPRGPRRFVSPILVAALLAMGGVACAVFAARSLSRSDAQRARQAFVQASNQVASTLRLAIAREKDLVVSAGVFELEKPDASNAQFGRWVRQERAFERYPELEGAAIIAFVRRAKLLAYEDHINDDPLVPHDVFTIVPAGIRPYYCFLKLAQNRGGPTETPEGVDYCASVPQLIKSRDSGQGYDYAIKVRTLSRTPLLDFEMPLYRGGGTPATAAARRHAFLGWTEILVSPKELLDSAMQGHPGMAVSLYDTDGPRRLTFVDGHAPPGAIRTTINLHDGSTVLTYASIGSAGLLANSNSRLLLFGGALLSALLFLLALVLLTGRRRALRLVSEKTEQLSHQAMHDGLTGLPNRALVLDRAEQMLARARRTHTPIATMFIDLDGFKDVNDTFGHAAGDRFLRIVADRLTSVVRKADTVGRLGGDEFVVLAEGESLFAGPEAVAERLLDVLRQPFEPQEGVGRLKSCSVSIGIATGQRDTADELLRDADIALYQAKNAGKDRYVIFEESMHTASADRVTLEVDLRDAITSDQLFLLYQPTFELQSGVVTGVEALLRWAHPTRGVVTPDVFIPLAEENAMIIPIGCWVLRRACEQAAIWHATGHEINVAVNVSARQLERDEFVAEVVEALRDSDLSPSALTLEITETVLMHDAAAAASRLGELKELGVRIAIDDFGTGYSSLAYLRQLPVDALKIDRSFITGISYSREAGALMHTLIQLGKTLGLETLGEGIEDQAQLEHLKDQDCDSGQGFLLAKPLDVEAVTRLLNRGPIRA